MTDLYDVAILGAGPAGANAALSAAGCDCKTIVIDEQPLPGGQVWRAKSAAIVSAPTTPETIAGDAIRHSISGSNVKHLGNARVWQIEQVPEGWALHFLTSGQVQMIIAKALVLATGAREFVQPVPGWTTPGVLGLAGATALLKQNMTIPGQRTVVSGTGPLVFFVASEIRRLGGTVEAIVTPNGFSDWLRATPSMIVRPDLMKRGAVWMADLVLARVPFFWRHAVTEIIGEDGVQSVTIKKVNADWAPIGTAQTLEADSLCLGNGLLPNVEAAQLAGVALDHNQALGGWVPNTANDGTTNVKGVFICGDGAGIRGAAAAEIHGKLTGLSAAKFAGRTTNVDAAKLGASYKRSARFGLAMTALSIPRPGMEKLTTLDTIVCRCESVKQKEILTEIESGAISASAVKSGVRAGMGPCGGKFCQTAIARLVASATDKNEADVVLPSARPPLRPVPTSALAGDFDYSDLPIPKPAPL